ncbi:MAG: ABC transporter ATP-binding protein [Alphaproteobacteria bacterium]
MIVTRELTKSFGSIKAVDGVSLTVARGEVLGFLGPNGAGKSTSMKMITGFLRPTSGEARICGFDVQDKPIEARRRLGYLPEGAPLYGDMTARAFLGFVAAARGLGGSEKRRRIGLAVERTNLATILDQPIETLSKGFKRRVGLAQALLHDPEVLILDEPTDGLDPNQKHEVRALIRELAPTKAIVISTHILEEVDAVCSRAVIIAGGRVVADGTPAELAHRSRHFNAVTVVVPADAADMVRTGLKSLETVEDVETDMRAGTVRLIAIPRDRRPIFSNVNQLLQAHAWPVLEVRTQAGDLEEVFRTITTGSAEPPALPPPSSDAPEKEPAHA